MILNRACTLHAKVKIVTIEGKCLNLPCNRRDFEESHGNMSRDEGWTLFKRRNLGKAKNTEDITKQVAIKAL